MAATRVGARLARRLASATAPPSADPPSKLTDVLLYGAPNRSFASTAGVKPPSKLKPPSVYGDVYVLYGAPTAAAYNTRCLSTTSSGASGGKPGATGVTDAAAGATGGAAAGATGVAAPGATGVAAPGATDGAAPGATGVAAAGATGVDATGATGSAAGPTDASRVILKPIMKITSEDVINEWNNSAGFRRGLYFGASVLIGVSAATVSFAYVSMENRLSNKLKVGLEEMKGILAAAQMKDIEKRNVAESKETERREAAEWKEKQRREDWARNMQLHVNDILSKIIKLEEKEWTNRHAVLQAEEVLKRVGFSSEAESYYEVAKRFEMLQFQVDYLKSELSKQKETPAAGELLQTIAAIDSQMTALKKRILEANIAGEVDLIQTSKGVASDQVKK